MSGKEEESGGDAKTTTKRKKRSWETDDDGKPIRQDHHVVPKSRSGDHRPENILTGMPSDLHWAYHHLFGNLTPEEIIAVLVGQFFRGGKFRPLYQRIVQRGDSLPIDPNAILMTLVTKLFADEDWIPSEELIKALQERRKRLPPVEID